MPRPIYDASRNETFASMRASVTNPAGSSASRISASGSALGSSASGSAPDCVVQADSGAYIIGTSPHVRLHDGALTIVPLDLNMRTEKEKIRHTTTHVAATSVPGSTETFLPNSEMEVSSLALDEWRPDLIPDITVHIEKEKIRQTTTHVASTSSLGSTVQMFGSMESVDSETVDSVDESEAEVDLVSLRTCIGAWLKDIEKEELDLLPVDVNDTDPFIPGVIGGMSVNDILMVKGHIDPSVYIRFFNLSLYAYSVAMSEIEL